MAKDLEEARKELEEEYANFRKHLGEVEVAWRSVSDANVEDDIVEKLEHLEEITKKVRTGGVMGSGANDHARALKEYLEAKGTPAPKK
jgi:hypothetical protein